MDITMNIKIVYRWLVVGCLLMLTSLTGAMPILPDLALMQDYSPESLGISQELLSGMDALDISHDDQFIILTAKISKTILILKRSQSGVYQRHWLFIDEAATELREETERVTRVAHLGTPVGVSFSPTEVVAHVAAGELGNRLIQLKKLPDDSWVIDEGQSYTGVIPNQHGANLCLLRGINDIKNIGQHLAVSMPGRLALLPVTTSKTLKSCTTFSSPDQSGLASEGGLALNSIGPLLPVNGNLYVVSDYSETSLLSYGVEQNRPVFRGEVDLSDYWLPSSVKDMFWYPQRNEIIAVSNLHFGALSVHDGSSEILDLQEELQSDLTGVATLNRSGDVYAVSADGTIFEFKKPLKTESWQLSKSYNIVESFGLVIDSNFPVDISKVTSAHQSNRFFALDRRNHHIYEFGFGEEQDTGGENRNSGDSHLTTILAGVFAPIAASIFTIAMIYRCRRGCNFYHHHSP